MSQGISRNNSIDNVRLLAIFSIIVMHTFPFFWVQIDGAKTAGIIINQLTRFGVPCFFVISGFLFAQKVRQAGVQTPLRKSVLRLLLLYAFWCFFYVTPYNLSMISDSAPSGNFSFAVYHWNSWVGSVENLLLGGSKAHLWFLPALLCATVICAPFIAYKQHAAMLAVTSALFVVALLAGPYKLIELPIGVRNGPLFSSLFFAIGAALVDIKNMRRLIPAGITLCLVGAAGQLAEVWALVARGYSPIMPIYPDFLISTIALGTGPALLAIAGVAARDNKPWLWGIGRYTLGIYALHFFVMDFFIPLTAALRGNLIWQIVAPLIFFALTSLLVMWLARIRFLRPLIM